MSLCLFLEVTQGLITASKLTWTLQITPRTGCTGYHLPFHDQCGYRKVEKHYDFSCARKTIKTKFKFSCKIFPAKSEIRLRLAPLQRIIQLLIMHFKQQNIDFCSESQRTVKQQSSKRPVDASCGRHLEYSLFPESHARSFRLGTVPSIPGNYRINTPTISILIKFNAM